MVETDSSGSSASVSPKCQTTEDRHNPQQTNEFKHLQSRLVCTETSFASTGETVTVAQRSATTRVIRWPLRMFIVVSVGNFVAS